MDWFGLWLDGLTLAGLSLLHIAFVGRLIGREPRVVFEKSFPQSARPTLGYIWHSRPGHFLGYFFLLCLVQMVCVSLHVGELLSAVMELAALYGAARVMWRGDKRLCAVASIFAVYASLLSMGLMDSLELLLIPAATRGRLLYVLLTLATLAAFLLCAGCYWLMLKFLSLKEGQWTPYLRVLLLPGIFFFSAEIYILQTAYGCVSQEVERGEQLALLLLQALGLGALICTLYAYRRICQGIQAQAMVAALEEASRAQRAYVGEARLRYEKTRAFRHDIRNHFSVLNGLLNGGKTEEAKAYLQKMETFGAQLSFPYQTGNPVVDILLGEKLELAGGEGIAAQVSLSLPTDWRIDDFDLCVIFANALDNAVSACRQVEGERWIHIKGECQGDFYMAEVKNACLPGPAPPGGTGLSNIKAAAEKYHGAILAEKEDGCFCLNVLLQMGRAMEEEGC